MSKKPAKKEAAEKRRASDAGHRIPLVNIGALFLPPIWGPAHGLWVAIVFYPLWIVADTCFVNALAERTPLAIAVGAVVFVALTAVTVAFSVASQKYALCRALAMGVSEGTYLKRQRIWAVASVLIGLAMIAAATYYNVCLNPRLTSAFSA